MHYPDNGRREAMGTAIEVRSTDKMRAEIRTVIHLPMVGFLYYFYIFFILKVYSQ